MSQIKLIQKSFKSLFLEVLFHRYVERIILKEHPYILGALKVLSGHLWFVKYAKVQQGQSQEKETIFGI